MYKIIVFVINCIIIYSNFYILYGKCKRPPQAFYRQLKLTLNVVMYLRYVTSKNCAFISSFWCISWRMYWLAVILLLSTHYLKVKTRSHVPLLAHYSTKNFHIIKVVCNATMFFRSVYIWWEYCRKEWQSYISK